MGSSTVTTRLLKRKHAVARRLRNTRMQIGLVRED